MTRVTLQFLLDGIDKTELSFDLETREGALAFIKYMETIATLVQNRPDLATSPAVMPSSKDGKPK